LFSDPAPPARQLNARPLLNLVEQISQKSGVAFRPAASSALEQLRAIGMPEDALAFYANSEPARWAEINRVRLSPIRDVLQENKDYVPGYHLHPLGYVVFASTIYGDAYCFDTSQAPANGTAPVVLMAHDLEWDEYSQEQIRKLAKRVASSLDDFLQKFAAGTLDMKPLYPPMDFLTP
jgi:hypothetical protein